LYIGILHLFCFTLRGFFLLVLWVSLGLDDVMFFYMFFDMNITYCKHDLLDIGFSMIFPALSGFCWWEFSIMVTDEARWT
jgi:hypothetical protein